MGKISLFHVELDRNVFFPGQIVTGKVRLNLEEEVKMTRIELDITGRANSFWSESQSSGAGKKRKSKSVQYKGEQNLMNAKIILYGKQIDQGGDDPHHPAGQAEYPFSVQLPGNLPSSVEHGNGSIRYLASAHIDIPWAFDYRTRTPFTVIGIVDLNHVVQANQPAQGTDQKELGVGCCSSGQLSAHVNLAKGGYVPGEIISVKANINNESSRQVKISLKLNQTIKLTGSSGVLSGDKQKIVRKAIVEKKEPQEIQENTNPQWGENIQIPAVLPSTMGGVMEIGYELALNLDPSGPSFDMDINIPISVGNIPHKSTFQQFLAPPEQRPFELPEQIESQYPDLPAANLLQSGEFGKINVKDKDDRKAGGESISFAPIFLVYPLAQ